LEPTGTLLEPVDFEGNPLRNHTTPVSLNLLEPAWNLQTSGRDVLEPTACMGETRHLFL
jgi:hypothetical protein